DFDVWVDDLQLFLQCDSKDGVSLLDHTSGVSTAPAATSDSTVRSQWTTRDAVARLAVRSHLPPTKRAHFNQYKTAKSLYDAVVVRYSSPATANLSRLMLPDHFLSLCPTELIVDLLEERLAAAEKSILAFPDAVELPRWVDMLRQNVTIFDLDFDAILAAMYALTDSAEGDSYLSVPPDPGIEAAALGASASAAPGAGESAAPGASESALSGTAPTEAFHTFTLDSGASRSFFRDSTTLTPLSQPVAVSLADLSGGPVLPHSSTVLPCPAAPSGLLSGLHLPSFSTNLLSGADLQDAWVDHFAPGGQRVTHCTCSRTGRHLATFTRRPGSSLYTLTTASPPVSASDQVAASSQVFAAASRPSPASAPCSCRPLSHETLLWHRHLGHPSLPQAPLQTLHMDVWGPARVRGKGHERYFLLVVDDYSRYTTVLPLRRKDRGGEFSSDLLRDFCHLENIRQTFTLPASPQQNGIAERRIGMVMDVARTSMIHAAAPHFLWLFTVQYAAHQINLQPRVSLPETTPTLPWMGKVGDAYAFRVWGSRAFVRDTTADKLSSRAVPYGFLGFPPDAPGWQFYHPTSHRVLSSHNVTFDESFELAFPQQSGLGASTLVWRAARFQLKSREAQAHMAAGKAKAAEAHFRASALENATDGESWSGLARSCVDQMALVAESVEEAAGMLSSGGEDVNLPRIHLSNAVTLALDCAEGFDLFAPGSSRDPRVNALQ
ncbi:unnamed protein product, partial [Closterium sp. NIES-53]